MSLIDEALKRARDQAGAPAAPSEAPARPLPRSDPWEYAPLPQRRRGRGAALWIASAAGALALAGGAYFLGFHGRGNANVGAPAAVGPAAAGTAPPASSTPPPAAGAPGAVWRPPVEVAPPPRRPALESPPAGNEPAAAPARAPNAVSPAPASEASPRARLASPPSRTILGADAARPPAPGAPRSYSVSLVAPNGGKVELGGIVLSENPVALVNGKVLPVGGVVEGLTVLAIEESRIELAGEGFRAYLTLK